MLFRSGDDFRDIRAALFGDQQRRQLADFRRSGATEALAGNATPEKLSKKMVNTLSESNRLHATYAPVQLASVRDVDAARKRGRAKLREQRPAESIRCGANERLSHWNDGASDGT